MKQFAGESRNREQNESDSSSWIRYRNLSIEVVSEAAEA